MSPRISILLVTFNHAHYIEKSLASIEDQNFDVRAELVVADDASTDGTLELIRQWAKKTRDSFTIHFLPEEENMGITRNYQRGFSACLGEYVAVIEGDDYWVSPRKIALQAEFLDEHLECDMCSCNYFVYDEDRADFTPRISPGPGFTLLTARQLIADNVVGNFSTCMYRHSALAALPSKVFEIRSYDWIVNICVAKRSLIGFLNVPMSVYRIHSGGAWSASTLNTKLLAQRDAIEEYDELTGRVFTDEFCVLHARLNSQISQGQCSTVDNFVGADIPVAGERLRLGARRILDITPPILVYLARVLCPPAFTRLARRAWNRIGS